MGDVFLRELYPTLQALRAKAVLDKKAKPYLFEYYNIIPSFPGVNSNVRSTVARIFNEFVTAMNERSRLPRYILFILDREILESADHNNFGVQRIIIELLEWLCRNIDKTIDLRREDVRLKRPGAIASSGEPRLIWTHMVTRPIINDPTRGFLFAQTRKYNDALDETVQKYKHTHVMDVNISAEDQRYFDKWGNLSGIGMNKYWCDLIQQIKLFDRAETDLRPGGKRIPTPIRTPGFKNKNKH